MRFPPLFSAPERTPREARARAAVEVVFAAALATSLALSWDAPSGDRARAPCGAGPPPAPLASIPVDLASDPPWVLRLLPGVGPVRAEALAADRDRNGPLPTLSAVLRVRGFGPKAAAALAAAGAVVGAIRPDGRPP